MIKLKIFITSMIVLGLVICAISQDDDGGQSRESMAVDATATQWSYQFAYEGFFDYKTDTLESGQVRPEGRKGFLQFRFVAPIPKGKIPFTMLPRLTLRLVEDQYGTYGFGSSDLFILGIVNQWKTGRWGIGPQINFPSSGPTFGNTSWGYGLAGALTQRAWKDRLFFAFLVQQTWSSKEGVTYAGALAINPSFVIQIAKGFYAGNGDYVISYNWQDKSWLIPIGIRVGKAIVGDKTTWNVYGEYSTSALYNDWQGPVATHAFRVNVQFQIPLSL